jgi:hypothetical protein
MKIERTRTLGRDHTANFIAISSYSHRVSFGCVHGIGST